MGMVIIGCGFVTQPRTLILYLTGNAGIQRGSAKTQLIGVSLGLLAAFGNAGISLTLRSMPKQETNSDIITLYNSTVSALLLWPVVCCLGFKFASIHDLAYVCLASVIVFTMIKARGEAYQRARVCTLQTVGSSDILFAYACDVIVFRKRPTASSIIGGIIVI